MYIFIYMYINIYICVRLCGPPLIPPPPPVVCGGGNSCGGFVWWDSGLGQELTMNDIPFDSKMKVQSALFIFAGEACLQSLEFVWCPEDPHCTSGCEKHVINPASRGQTLWGNRTTLTAHLVVWSMWQCVHKFCFQKANLLGQ